RADRCGRRPMSAGRRRVRRQASRETPRDASISPRLRARNPPAGYFGKRASGRTFSTGAEGAGGVHSARKTPPPSNTKAITRTNAMVSFPMPQLVFPSPTAGSRPRRLTIGLQDMLVPFPGAGQESGGGLGGVVQIGTAEAGRQGATARGFAPRRTVVLVGLMGAGKSNIGRRLAARLGLPFFDSDDEIEAAAGETIEEIFRNRGEAVFRDGERKVIARLLDQPTHILATGGGGFFGPAI